MFVLYEIDVRGPKNIYDHIRDGNVWEKFRKDKLRVL